MLTECPILLPRGACLKKFLFSHLVINTSNKLILNHFTASEVLVQRDVYMVKCGILLRVFSLICPSAVVNDDMDI